MVSKQMTKEQLDEWKSNPATQEIYKKIKGVKLALQDSLASGQTLCTTADETHGSTAKMVGKIEGLNQLLDISCEDEDEANESEDD